MQKVWRALQNFRLPLKPVTIKIIFYLILAASLFSIWLESASRGRSWYFSTRNEVGELIWNLLVFTVMISLARKLVPSVKLFSQLLFLRKLTGVAAFFLIIVHIILHFLGTGVLGNVSGMLAQSVGRNLAAALAVISFILMIPLALTSFNFAIKKMGAKNWTLLHKLVHPAFILAGLHIALAGGEADELGVMVLYFLGYFWLFFRKQFRKKPAEIKASLK